MIAIVTAMDMIIGDIDMREIEAIGTMIMVADAQSARY